MAHRRIGDTRNRPKHTTPPQTKKRSLIGSFSTYEKAAQEAAMPSFWKGVKPSPITNEDVKVQIRKNKHGFGVYQRVAS